MLEHPGEARLADVDAQRVHEIFALEGDWLAGSLRAVALT
jgi:hypothetical protein